MLTFENISSASEGTKYYCQTTNFYSINGEVGQHKEWFGKGAEDLGLVGEVKDEEFFKILQGKITYQNQQIQLGKKTQDELGLPFFDHAPGVDFTFASPKSVSLLSNLGEDPRIKEAEIASVKKILAHIEKEYVYTRVKEAGQIRYERVDNIISGLFYENLNRDKEWHNHIHVTFANMVKSKDGKWRSAYLSEIVRNHIHLGKLYRSELAFALRKLGYEIRITNKEQLFFEIKGVSDDLIAHYSQRTTNINEKALELSSNPNSRTKQTANLLTREQKNSSLAEIFYIIKDKINDFIIKSKKPNFLTSLQKLVKESHQNQLTNQEEDKIKFNAKEAVGFAIAHLSERSTIFSHQDILDHALKGYFGEMTEEIASDEIDRLKKSEFIFLGQGKYKTDGRDYYTTRHSLEREKAIISAMKNTQGIYEPITSEAEAIRILESLVLKDPKKQKLNKGQMEAAVQILTSTDKVYGIQGYAGVGKTFMLSKVKLALEIINQERIKKDPNHISYELVGLAPSGAAVKELQKVGIKANTLQGLLSARAGYAAGRGTIEGLEPIKAEYKNKIFITDEASMIPAKDMQDLITISTRLDFRIPLIGDRQQILSVEEGNSFFELQREGMKTIKMNEIVRQKTQIGKAISYSAYAKDFVGLFNKVGSNLIDCATLKEINHIKEQIIKNKIIINKDIDYNDPKEIAKLVEFLDSKGVRRFNSKDNTEDRVNNADTAMAAAKLYTSFDTAKRQETIMIAQANDSKNLINEFVREIFIADKILGEKADKIRTLVNANPTIAQRGNEITYKTGQIILFNKLNRNLNIKKNEYFRIVSINDKKELKLKSLDDHQKTILFNPKLAKSLLKHIELYNEVEREFRPNDHIIFTRKIDSKTKEESEIVNSTTGQIKNINKDTNSYTIEIEGKELEFKNDHPALKHIDYSYCRTTHKGQGATAHTAIVITESWWNHLTNDRNLLVQATRQEHELFLIVDNKTAVIDKILEAKQEREGAIEFTENNKQDLIKKLEVKQSLFDALGGVVEFNKYQIALEQAKSFDANIANRNPQPVLTNDYIDPVLRESENFKSNLTAADIIFNNKSQGVLKLEEKIKKEVKQELAAQNPVNNKDTNSNKTKAINQTYDNSKPQSKYTAKQETPAKQYLVADLSSAQVKEHFLDAIKSNTNIDLKNCGHFIDEAFSNCGTKFRFGDKKENELCWYGEAGYIKNFKTGDILKWGIGNIKANDQSKLKTISKQELKEKLEKADLIKKQTLKQKSQTEQKIATITQKYFNSYSQSGTSNYLKKKNINFVPQDVRFNKQGDLIIPVRDVSGKIWSLQSIKNDGSKRFFKDGKKQGNFFLFIKNDSTLPQEKEIILAEGFATAASIHQATGKPVAVCFDAGNIEHVLKNLKTAHPNKQFTIAADNDAWKDRNIGKEKAIVAGAKYGAKVILPHFKDNHQIHKPTDFNDLHKLVGIEEVRRQITSHQNQHQHQNHSQISNQKEF